MTLRIGGLRRAPEANVETIRYYERIGLLIAPARIEGSYCAYGEAELNRLCFIRRGRNLGFSIEQVCDLLACRIAGINHALMWTPWPMRGALAECRSEIPPIMSDAIKQQRLRIKIYTRHVKCQYF